MGRLIKTLVLIAVFYVAPLLGAPERILNGQIAVLMAACLVLFYTQPEMKFDEALRQSPADRFSFFAILSAGAVSQIAPVVEWGYFSDGQVTPARYPWIIAGLALVIGGLAFRIWAIRTLGSSFTATVKTADEQQVVTSGPYAVVRHPSYLGALMAIIGSAVFLYATVGTVVATVAMMLAYGYRIVVEEQALVRGLGEPYERYRTATRFRLIPGVW